MRCPHCKKEFITTKVNDDQRGWYYAGIIPFLQKLVPQWEHLSVEQVHEVLKTEFNGFTITDKNGNKRKYGQSVANNTVNNKAFDQYIKRIEEWVRSNYGIELPEPN